MSVLPPDPVQMEQTIAGTIKDILLSVPEIADYVRVYTRERFPDNEEDDLDLSTVPDPVNDDLAMTSIIQIGMPTVQEIEYAGNCGSQLNFSYPITFDLGVKDVWDTTGVPLLYPNSRELAMAIYMRARKAFKDNRTLGFDNCLHEYLQQEGTGVVEDEESGGRLHVADWSLTVKCTSIVN